MTPNSRSYINHFIQPDSIIPDLNNAQDWNRYSYAKNNPVRYFDPTGHMAVGDSVGEAGCDTPGSPACILKKYGWTSTASEQIVNDEIYYYSLAYPDYDPMSDPYLEGTPGRAIVGNIIGGYQLQEQLDNGTATGASVGAFLAWGFLAPPIPAPIRQEGQGPQNFGNDPADPDCPGCGYSWDLSASTMPGGEPQTTVLGFSEDVSFYQGVNVNTLQNQPYYNWGMNTQFLKAGMCRGDTFVFVSNPARYPYRLFPAEVQFLGPYTNIVYFHP